MSQPKPLHTAFNRMIGEQGLVRTYDTELARLHVAYFALDAAMHKAMPFTTHSPQEGLIISGLPDLGWSSRGHLEVRRSFGGVLETRIFGYEKSHYREVNVIYDPAQPFTSPLDHIVVAANTIEEAAHHAGQAGASLQVKSAHMYQK